MKDWKRLIAEGLGWFLIFTGIGLGIGGCKYLTDSGRAKVIQAEQSQAK